MVLYAPYVSTRLFKVDNWGANPTNIFGANVIPGSANSVGSWVQTAGASNIAEPVNAFTLWLYQHSGTGNKQIQVDIGVDEAGGTAYEPIIANVVCGNMSTAITAQGGGSKFVFPYAIPQGSSVAVRARSRGTAVNSIRAAMEFYGRRNRPETMPRGQYSETIGHTVTDSSGTRFTPGNAANGAWQLLGTTTKPLFWWQLSYSIDNGTITAEYTWIDLAFGGGSDSNTHIMMTALHGGTTAEIVADLADCNMNFYNCYCPLPAGTNIYVRGRCQNAPDTGYVAAAVGIGGG